MKYHVISQNDTTLCFGFIQSFINALKCITYFMMVLKERQYKGYNYTIKTKYIFYTKLNTEQRTHYDEQETSNYEY